MIAVYKFSSKRFHYYEGPAGDGIFVRIQIPRKLEKPMPTTLDLRVELSTAHRQPPHDRK